MTTLAAVANDILRATEVDVSSLVLEAGEPLRISVLPPLPRLVPVDLPVVTETTGTLGWEEKYVLAAADDVGLAGIETGICFRAANVNADVHDRIESARFL